MRQVSKSKAEFLSLILEQNKTYGQAIDLLDSYFSAEETDWLDATNCYLEVAELRNLERQLEKLKLSIMLDVIDAEGAKKC